MMIVKIAFTLVVVVLTHCLVLGASTLQEWKEDLKEYFKEYADLWADRDMEYLVTNLFASEFIRLSPGSDLVIGAAVTVAVYEYLYDLGYKSVTWDESYDVLPTGDDGVVGWTKYTFTNNNATFPPQIGEAAYYIIKEEGKLKAKLLMTAYPEMKLNAYWGALFRLL